MFEKKHQNSGTLGKDTINKWIIPFLSVGKRGFKSNFDLATIFLLILKRLKTGVQWRELPIESYFEKGEISWQNVYYYFNKWSKDGSFQRVWLNLLSKKKRKLDMSCVQLDVSQTRCRQKLDEYKDLIMRYEYLDVTWIGMLLLGFIYKFLKKSLNTFYVTKL